MSKKVAESKFSHADLEEIANQLCYTVDGDFDIYIKTNCDDEVFHKLVMLINFVLDTARRSLMKINNQTEKISESNTRLNEFIAELEQKQDEVNKMENAMMAISRQAGKAEVATSILHNIGNVLNSINISISELKSIISNSKLYKISTLLQQKQDVIENMKALFDDKEHQMVFDYLLKILSRTLLDHAKVTNELTSLHKNVEHIKIVVKDQQGYAKDSHIKQEVDLATLLNETLAMINIKMENANIIIRKDLQHVPLVITDRHTLLQILINLLVNAIDAIKESKNYQTGMITVCLQKNNNKMIEISIIDNGIGIKKDDLSKLFQYGYTTKDYGHGFGLHSCANSAKHIGWQLVVQSDGINQGATFKLLYDTSNSKTS